jgi:hypothetical protein
LSRRTLRDEGPKGGGEPGGDGSEQRRFVNNPFARALHPVPSRSPWARIALALVSVVGALIMGAALLLPLGIVPGLIVGGARAGRWASVGVGVLVAALYLALIAGGAKRLLRRARSR